MPCPQIDHPEILKELVETHGMVPTHEGAEAILGEHYAMVCQNALAVRQSFATDNDPTYGRGSYPARCETCRTAEAVGD